MSNPFAELDELSKDRRIHISGRGGKWKAILEATHDIPAARVDGDNLLDVIVECAQLVRNPHETNLALLRAKTTAEAQYLLSIAQIVEVEFPSESHCDQCSLQGVCDYLHDREKNYSDCKAYPRVYRLPAGVTV